MDIIVSETSSSNFTRELIPADTHVARCVEMIQIGTVPKTFEGKTTMKPQLRITWELPEILHEYEGKQEPAYIAQEYTISLHENAGLRKALKSWRGVDFTPEELAGFSLKSLLGAPCMLSVIHASKDSKTYANVGTISRLPKKLPCPEQITPSRMLAYGEGFDWTAFEALPDFLKNKMTPTPEYAAQLAARSGKPARAAQGVPAGADDDNDLPF